jgi:hypothetical protein
MCDCIKNLYSSKTQKNTPIYLWNTYLPQNRAYINDLNVNETFDISQIFSNIECIYFDNLDRGIQSWNIFNNALKKIFPNLKSLFLKQNYSISLEKDFIEFFEDPWLDHIWIVDFQSRYKCIQKEMIIPIEKIRVFDTYSVYCDEHLYCEEENSYDSNLINIDLSICIIFYNNDLILKNTI